MSVLARWKNTLSHCPVIWKSCVSWRASWRLRRARVVLLGTAVAVLLASLVRRVPSPVPLLVLPASLVPTVRRAGSPVLTVPSLVLLVSLVMVSPVTASLAPMARRIVPALVLVPRPVLLVSLVLMALSLVRRAVLVPLVMASPALPVHRAVPVLLLVTEAVHRTVSRVPALTAPSLVPVVPRPRMARAALPLVLHHLPATTRAAKMVTVRVVGRASMCVSTWRTRAGHAATARMTATASASKVRRACVAVN